MTDPVTSSQQQLLDENVSELLDEETQRNILVRTFMGANRATRRTLAYGRKQAVHIGNTIVAGIKGLMPLLGFLIGVSVVAAGIGAALGLSSWALTAAFAIHPLAGWSVVTMVALLCTRIAVGVVTSIWESAFAA